MEFYLLTDAEDLLQITLNSVFSEPQRAYFIVSDEDLGSAYELILTYAGDYADGITEETLSLPLTLEIDGKFYYACTWKMISKVSTSTSLDCSSFEGAKVRTQVYNNGPFSIWGMANDAEGIAWRDILNTPHATRPDYFQDLKLGNEIIRVGKPDASNSHQLPWRYIAANAGQGIHPAFIYEYSGAMEREFEYLSNGGTPHASQTPITLHDCVDNSTPTPSPSTTPTTTASPYIEEFSHAWNWDDVHNEYKLQLGGLVRPNANYVPKKLYNSQTNAYDIETDWLSTRTVYMFNGTHTNFGIDHATWAPALIDPLYQDITDIKLSSWHGDSKYTLTAETYLDTGYKRLFVEVESDYDDYVDGYIGKQPLYVYEGDSGVNSFYGDMTYDDVEKKWLRNDVIANWPVVKWVFPDFDLGVLTPTGDDLQHGEYQTEPGKNYLYVKYEGGNYKFNKSNDAQHDKVYNPDDDDPYGWFVIDDVDPMYFGYGKFQFNVGLLEEGDAIIFPTSAQSTDEADRKGVDPGFPWTNNAYTNEETASVMGYYGKSDGSVNASATIEINVTNWDDRTDSSWGFRRLGVSSNTSSTMSAFVYSPYADDRWEFSPLTPPPPPSPTATYTAVEVELPGTPTDDVFLVRMEKPALNDLYYFLQSQTSTYTYVEDDDGDYVTDELGVRVSELDGDGKLPLADAQKLVFNPAFGGGAMDVTLDNHIVKWILTTKNPGQWDTTNPANFDSNDPRMKLRGFTTGCPPVHCIYPHAGEIYQVNVKGMNNLTDLGIHHSPYLVGLYGMENLSLLENLTLQYSHSSEGYGEYDEYPTTHSSGAKVPFASYPPNLKTLSVASNPAILNLVKLPISLEILNASGTKISSISAIETTNSGNTFPNLKELNVAGCPLTSITGISSKMPVLEVLSASSCGLTGVCPTLPSTLKTVDLNYNSFTTLPTLPSTLETLYVSYNRLTDMPTLPASLVTLYALGGETTTGWPDYDPVLLNPLASWSISASEGAGLTHMYISGISELPTGIHNLPTLLVLHANSVTVSGALPTLPSTLTQFYMSLAELTDVSGLSACPGLVQVGVSGNLISTLAGLNASKSTITHLYVQHNELTNADNDFSGFTAVMSTLYAGDNNFTAMTVPTSVAWLNFVGNPFTDSLPNLSSVTGSVNLTLETSYPPSGKYTKIELEPADKTAIMQSFPTSNQINIGLTVSGVPLPNENWWKNSRVTSLSASGEAIDTSANCTIPTACTSATISGADLPTLSLSATELTHLVLSGNTKLTSVALASQPNLGYLNLGSGGLLTSLTGSLPLLTTLNVSNEPIVTLGITNASSLTSLTATNTQINQLNITSYASLTYLNLSNCKNLGNNLSTSQKAITFPSASSSSVLNYVNVSNADLDSTDMQAIFIDLAQCASATPTTNSTMIYYGNGKRPTGADPSYSTLKGLGWSFNPEDPSLDAYTQISSNTVHQVSKQDLFESRRLYLMFQDSSASIKIAGNTVPITGEPGKPFRFGNTAWSSSEIGVTKRVRVGGFIYVKVTWYGYGSIFISVEDFEEVVVECMPAFDEPDTEGIALGSVGLSAIMSQIEETTELPEGANITYLTFVDSLSNEFVPSEEQPVAFGIGHTYRFDLTNLTEDYAIRIRAWTPSTLENVAEPTEVSLPVDATDDNLTETENVPGFYGGVLVVGPVPDGVEWMTWDFVNGTEIPDGYGRGRQFQWSSSCDLLLPSPTPTETPSPTATATPTTTATPTATATPSTETLVSTSNFCISGHTLENSNGSQLANGTYEPTGNIVNGRTEWSNGESYMVWQPTGIVDNYWAVYTEANQGGVNSIASDELHIPQVWPWDASWYAMNSSEFWIETDDCLEITDTLDWLTFSASFIPSGTTESLNGKLTFDVTEYDFSKFPETWKRLTDVNGYQPSMYITLFKDTYTHDPSLFDIVQEDASDDNVFLYDNQSGINSNINLMYLVDDNGDSIGRWTSPSGTIMGGFPSIIESAAADAPVNILPGEYSTPSENYEQFKNDEFWSWLGNANLKVGIVFSSYDTNANDEQTFLGQYVQDCSTPVPPSPTPSPSPISAIAGAPDWLTFDPTLYMRVVPDEWGTIYHHLILENMTFDFSKIPSWYSNYSFDGNEATYVYFFIVPASFDGSLKDGYDGNLSDHWAYNWGSYASDDMMYSYNIQTHTLTDPDNGMDSPFVASNGYGGLFYALGDYKNGNTPTIPSGGTYASTDSMSEGEQTVTEWLDTTSDTEAKVGLLIIHENWNTMSTAVLGEWLIPCTLEQQPEPEPPTMTPSPTPFPALSSWLTFDSAHLYVHPNSGTDDDVLELKNLQIIQNLIPTDFSNLMSDPSTAGRMQVNWAIVKDSYTGDMWELFNDTNDYSVYYTNWNSMNEIEVTSVTDYTMNYSQTATFWANLNTFVSGDDYGRTVMSEEYDDDTESYPSWSEWLGTDTVKLVLNIGVYDASWSNFTVLVDEKFDITIHQPPAT